MEWAPDAINNISNLDATEVYVRGLSLTSSSFFHTNLADFFKIKITILKSLT